MGVGSEAGGGVASAEVGRRAHRSGGGELGLTGVRVGELMQQRPSDADPASL
jgi:hypothetical protein